MTTPFSIPAQPGGAAAEATVIRDTSSSRGSSRWPYAAEARAHGAFRELARRAPLAVEVNAPTDRFDPGIEAAAYFVGCEGLTNAIKHAHATRVSVSALQQNGRLVVSVSDNGVGGASLTHGSGLSGLHDRVATLGGTLRLESEQASGTTLTAELPCRS